MTSTVELRVQSVTVEVAAEDVPVFDIISKWYMTLRAGARRDISIENLYDLSHQLRVMKPFPPAHAPDEVERLTRERDEWEVASRVEAKARLAAEIRAPQAEAERDLAKSAAEQLCKKRDDAVAERDALRAHIESAWCAYPRTTFACNFCCAPGVDSPSKEIKHDACCPTQALSKPPETLKPCDAMIQTGVNTYGRCPRTTGEGCDEKHCGLRAETLKGEAPCAVCGADPSGQMTAQQIFHCETAADCPLLPSQGKDV